MDQDAPEMGNDSNTYVVNMKKGNNNILVAVRARPLLKKEKLA
jgi:hypothetical protein